MGNKKAILILGTQNSGKTSTIKHVCGVKRLVEGKRHICGISKEVFVKGNSPSEEGKSLENYINEYINKRNMTIDDINNLIIAEQIDGEKLANTISFLQKNNFHLVIFAIQNPPIESNYNHWNYIDKTIDEDEFNNRLDKRKADILYVLDDKYKV